MVFTIVSIMCLQLILFLYSVYYIYKNPFDIGTLMVLLFIIFYAFPAWDFYFNGVLFLQTIQDYNVNFESEAEGLYLIFITTLIMLAFYISYLLTISTQYGIKRKKIEYRVNVSNFLIIASFIIVAWLGVFIYVFSNYDQGLLLFFTPSRKEELFDSTYVSLLYQLLPLTLFIMKCLKDYVEINKIKFKTYIFVIPLLAVYMTTGQRREIISLLIFLLVLATHFGIEKRKEKQNFKINKYKRKRLIQLGVFSLISIPMLWWGRVLFTQLQRGSTNIVLPWEQRGFLELIFGSSSGGFKTLLLGLEHQDLFQVPWGYSVYFFITSFIPRSVLENKPIVINKLWQQDFGLEGNPSTFYVNEMLINFGILGVLISAVFGGVLAFFYYRFYFSSSILYNIFAFLILSEVILLFKNGFTQFVINISITLLLIGIACSYSFKKNIEEKT